MKQIQLIVLAILLSIASFAGPKNFVIDNNGKWSQASSWSEGRLPMDGDTIIVPPTFTIQIDNNINLGTATVYIKIYGTLHLKNGKLDLGNNSVLVLLAGGQITSFNNLNANKITIGGILKYIGSEGTLTGPIATSAITGISPTGFSSIYIALPVKFIGFNLARKEKDVLIQWSTSQEINAGVYEVERSTNGVEWNRIATVDAVGNSSQVNNYSYTDKNITAPVIYYRIRQVDIDGQFSYTEIRSIRADSQFKVEIAVNNNNILLHFPKEVKGKIQVQVVSLAGQVIKQQTITDPVGQVILSTPLKGNYVVAVFSTEWKEARQIIL